MGAVTAPRLCRCGCALPAGPRSAYAADHYRRLCRARRRLARLARFASERGIPFDLEVSDLLALMQPFGTDARWRITRLDRSHGFSFANIRLVPGAEPSVLPKLEATIAQGIRRQGYEVDAHVVRALAERLLEGGGRCELTGRTLQLDCKTTDPDALAIRIVDFDQRAVMVVRSVAELIDRHGLRYLKDLLRGLRQPSWTNNGEAAAASSQMSRSSRGSARPREGEKGGSHGRQVPQR